MKLLRSMSVVTLVALLLLTSAFTGEAQAATKFAAPQISTITLKNARSATIKWGKVFGAKGYAVYRATKKSGKYTEVKTTKYASFTDSKLTANKTYYYKVRAYKTQGGKTVYSKYSPVKSIKMQLKTPVLAGGGAMKTTVALSWDKVVGAGGYQVYRAASQGGAYQKIASPTATAFTDGGLAAGQSYFYKVRAYSKVLGKTYYSKYSGVVKMTTLLQDPPTLAAPLAYSMYIKDTTLSIGFYKVANAEGYELYRSTSATGGFTSIGTSTGDAFEETNLTPEATYYYKVRAYASVGGARYYGPFGAVVTVTTKEKTPKISFVTANPVISESLYKNGFFYGTKLYYDMIVTDTAGQTSITITETMSGSPNGNSKTYTQTRVIPINGPGTYHLSQEMWNGYAGYADKGSMFTYKVSACGETYSRAYTCCYSAYNGSWAHYFGLT